MMTLMEEVPELNQLFGFKMDDGNTGDSTV